MQTYMPLQDFVANPSFGAQRRAALDKLRPEDIDPPIRETILAMNRLDYCFTLQCCWGHFVFPGNLDEHNLNPLPDQDPGCVIRYRLAYVALCLDNTAQGHAFLAGMRDISRMDPACIQVGCAQWFWNSQVNSFVIQAELERHQHQDTANVNFEEARRLDKARDLVFQGLQGLLDNISTAGQTA